jgi:large subunit ribosomal protein L4
MKVDVYNTGKDKVDSVDLPDEVFGADVKESLLWEQVKAQRASRRRGTHSAKTRATIRGGRAKPYRQKGTGRARQGSTRGPHHVGGAVAMGPRPKDWSYRLPKSARRAALRSALSLRARQEHLVVLDGFPVETPRTKTVTEFLVAFGMPSALIVDVKNEGLSRSARNLVESKYIAADGINVYDILDHEHLVLTRAAVDEVIKKAAKVGRPS